MGCSCVILWLDYHVLYIESGYVCTQKCKTHGNLLTVYGVLESPHPPSPKTPCFFFFGVTCRKEKLGEPGKIKRVCNLCECMHICKFPLFSVSNTEKLRVTLKSWGSLGTRLYFYSPHWRVNVVIHVPANTLYSFITSFHPITRRSISFMPTIA